DAHRPAVRGGRRGDVGAPPPLTTTPSFSIRNFIPATSDFVIESSPNRPATKVRVTESLKALQNLESDQRRVRGSSLCEARAERRSPSPQSRLRQWSLSHSLKTFAHRARSTRAQDRRLSSSRRPRVWVPAF